MPFLGKLGFDFLVHLFNVIARHCQIGDPAGYSVLAGKRRTQAKDKQANIKSLFGQKRSL